MAYWNKRGGGVFVPKAGPSTSSWVDAPREGWTAHQLKPENRERLRNCKEYDLVPFSMVGEAPIKDAGRVKEDAAKHMARTRREGVHGHLQSTGRQDQKLSVGFELMGADGE